MSFTVCPFSREAGRRPPCALDLCARTAIAVHADRGIRAGHQLIRFVVWWAGFACLQAI